VCVVARCVMCGGVAGGRHGVMCAEVVLLVRRVVVLQHGWLTRRQCCVCARRPCCAGGHMCAHVRHAPCTQRSCGGQMPSHLELEGPRQLRHCGGGAPASTSGCCCAPACLVLAVGGWYHTGKIRVRHAVMTAG
jgi:hypothetical protein